ncbi:mandelate racemase/muconate lactonizing enzyme family protein [Acidobacteria bacterium AH-259-L09]|nr:mandelate racemase/muconate lactonizing enzyme family protein [Acidobacteria bacterium AH-259-L09]
MKIVDIREQSISISSAIRNAVIQFSEMTASAVVIITDIVREGRAVMGYGFNSNGRYAQSGILRERMIPRLLKAPNQALLSDGRENFDPFKAWQVMMTNEKPGGHGERSAAVGALDMALWDLVAKVEEKPLHRLLAERYGGGIPNPDVYVYAAGGYYYPGKDLSALQDEIQAYLDQGYDTVKIKIGGAPLDEDLRRIEAVLKVVGSAQRLALDANARFNREVALQYSDALAPYGLKWYEEPVDPLDFASLAEVSRSSSTPLATGENLFSMQDSRNLLRYGGLIPTRDILQMDPALSYGLVEYLRTLEMLKAEDWSWQQCIPHGGHQMAVHIAAGLGLGGSEAYPGVFQPFGGFADGAKVEQGRLRIPEAPGIGIELKADLMKVFRAISD